MPLIILFVVILAVLFGLDSCGSDDDAAASPVYEKSNAGSRAAASRQDEIEKQFSAFSGAHRTLERTIKSAMNDPDSYEHVETGYADDGESLRVQTTYRGKNAFGGVVTNRVTARVSLDGDILEILEE